MKRNCCDKDGTCILAENGLEQYDCKYCVLLGDGNCEHGDMFTCKNPDAREEAGCDE